ncbi:unnamed protein product [Rhizophagus irregularis]|nr:unnamed protein product [Rhizophagus irregularis]
MSVSSVNTSATILVAAQMTNITSEEKRNLLFDVNCFLEVQMEDFDENWWPLVSNIWTQWTSYKQVNGNFWKIFTCYFTKYRDSSTRQKENISNEKCRITKTRPSGLCHAKIKVEWLVSLKIVKVGRYKDSSNHTHSLLDVDRLKRPQVIRTLVEKEAVKNYLPLAITAAVKEYATIELGLGASAQELKRKEVTNIKYKVRGPMEVHLVGNSDLKLDISQSVSYLKEQGYQVEIYCVHQRSTKGIVFAHPEQLEKLENHGWLTLIDSTHKTNRYDWRLFTLYVCDTYRCWNIDAHFFVSSEDSDTVAEALKKIRSYCRWTPATSYLIKVLSVAIDCKKQSDSKSAAFDFRVKKVSAYGVEKDIIEEIHKFPLPFQHLLIKEACAVMDRLEKGKGAPGLTSLDCHYLFRNRYLLPCKHIFHEHMYGDVKLLTTDVWRIFQKIFEESGFEVYEHRELVIEFVQTEQQKKAESRKLTVFELTERVRDRYWSVEEGVMLREQRLLFLH